MTYKGRYESWCPLFSIAAAMAGSNLKENCDTRCMLHHEGECGLTRHIANEEFVYEMVGELINAIKEKTEENK